MKLLFLTILATALTFASVTANPLPELLKARDFAGETHYLYKDGSSLTVSDVKRPGVRPMVTAMVNNSINITGWDFVQINIDKQVLAHDPKAYFYAGYAEGFLTQERMDNINAAQVERAVWKKPKVANFMVKHIQYMEIQVDKNPHDPFWAKIGQMMDQMQGLSAGFNAKTAVTNSSRQMSFYDVFMVNFNNEIDDINIAMYENNAKVSAEHNAHCSAMIRVTDHDVFFGHDTWAGYNTMVRQYKIYVFETTVVMDSYAGVINSGNDWYVTSNNIASQETTLEFYNYSLASAIVPETVSEFLRVMVANYLAKSAPEWVKLFSRGNSGTYCNQWMVLDYNLYTPGDKGTSLKDNLFWIAEQMPGMIKSGDMTPTLRTSGYWASYNVPYFKELYDIAGFEQMLKYQGNIDSYTKYARPMIFKRNHTDVVDLQTMKNMMRYNNWQHDPLSAIGPEVKGGCPNCSPANSPMLSIASRGDLVPSGAVLPKVATAYVQRSAFGAIDSKVASYAMLKNGMQATAVCGPTHDQQSVFKFTEEWEYSRPPGSSDAYGFDWQYFNVVAIDELHEEKKGDKVRIA